MCSRGGTASTRRGGRAGFWGIGAAGDSQSAACRSSVLLMAAPGQCPAAAVILLAVHAMGLRSGT